MQRSHPITLPELAHVDPTALDHRALRAEAAATEAALRALKAQLRRTWTAPMAALQRRFVALRREATIACVLRAGLRGRRHLRAADEAIWAAAARLADRHRRPSPTIEAADALG
ncbi:MAG: hypothetical protein R3B09_23325 [Nannocystaceae bacterium]